MQMSEQKQFFISRYFTQHNYSMRGYTIHNLMFDKLLTTDDLMSLVDDVDFESQICAIVERNLQTQTQLQPQLQPQQQ